MQEHDTGQVRFLTTDEKARELQVSERTLFRLRQENQGPRFVRIGGAIRYLPADLALTLGGVGEVNFAAIGHEAERRRRAYKRRKDA
ncbi:helix-turn-helix transcriptional regulator [Paracoccus ravus]|uniref:helix-turn-helix transcriptional regulator n=1 Tax=Paracoccus ravus TaxID=2447760 RepID=UPI001ADD1745|nr:helix-turn-helix domain-containing protein [Paracoccus ravus]